MYNISTDKESGGFDIKNVGSPPADKVQEVYFSCSGNLFTTIEQEGRDKNILSFYMIHKNTEEKPAAQPVPTKKGAKNVPPVNQLGSEEESWSFKKLARYEVKDRRFYAKWDESGRYFVLQGRKGTILDKTPKNIRFFNMFGELLENYDEVKALDQVHFRPRPKGIVKATKTQS